jgi:rubrerythrin
MGSAINSEEETIVFYKDLLDMFPDFAPVLKDIIAEEEKHIGQLEVLRNSSSSEMTKNIEKGVEEAEHQLETGSSEEPDDLGEAEVEVADIAIEIPEEDTVETASKGEIPTEGDFKEYSDKAEIEDAEAEIESEDEKSRYIDDILNEDASKKKWIYQGPIYDDYGMVVRDGYEWVHADDKQAAVKELIKRLKKAYKSSHIHIEPQFVKAEEESLITEAYNPEVKPGDKIRIIDMAGEPHYAGRTGEVEYIDDMGQIHGTWGGCALIPEEDTYELIVDECLTEELDLEEAYIFPKLGSLPNAREQILELIKQDNLPMVEFIIDGHIEVPYIIKAKHLTSGQQRVGTLTDFEVETDGSITIYFDRNGYQKYEDLEYIISDVPRSTITYTMLKAIQNAATKLNKQTGTAVARDNNVYALLQQNPEIAEEFKQAIKKIAYEIPLLDQYSPIGELDKDGELLSEEAIEKLEKIYDNFINLPFANDAIDAGMVKHRDFTTDTSHNIATSWGGIGLITFNCTLDQLSEHAQALILTAKVKKEDSDGKVVDKTTMISCYRLANALIKYFDNDIGFYQKKAVLVASLKNK